MRIGIDARWIFPEISGIGRYTRELLCGLAKVDPQNKYVVFFNNRDVLERTMAEEAIQAAPNFTPYLLNASLFSFTSQVMLPGIFKRLGIEVFHSTNYMIPFLAFPRDRIGKVGCVVTIHDLIPLIFPDQTPKAKKTKLLPLFRWILKEAARRADVLIAPSQASRLDIQDYLGVSEEMDKVDVIHEGVDTRFLPATRTWEKEKNILYVGRFDPYKNVVGLIEIFAKIRQYKQDVRLEIIGPPDPRYPEAQQRAEELELNEFITWRGYVDAKELLEAYQQADILTLLSRYEGFGLPVLEAMACGTPVVCSDTGSLPEVVEDAAMMFDPDDREDVVDAMLSLLTDAHVRDDYRKKGLQQASKYNWRSTAERTIESYERARPRI